MLAWCARRIGTLQIVVDCLAVLAAWQIAYVVRFDLIGSAQEGLFQRFLSWGAVLVVLTAYFFSRSELYDRKRLQSVTDDLMSLFRANALSVVSFVVFLYFIAEDRISRLTILLYAIVSTLLLIATRLIGRSFTRKARRKGYLLQRAFVIGDGTQLRRYLQSVSYTPGSGIKIIGQFGASNNKSPEIRQFNLSELSSAINEQNPDIVVLGFEDEKADWVAQFIREHYDQLFRIQVLSSERHALLGMTSEYIDGLPVLTLNDSKLSLPEVAAKRAIDLIGSTLGLVILAPALGLISIFIKLSSPGPIFFGQERVGVDGRTFKMWKFRSMRVASPEESKGWTVENDPRRTKFGTFIRKTSLDELPQLWNVFVGDMSLVGPRPEQTHFVEQFRYEIPAYMLRHKMKAGITGWAQVSGWRGDTSLHKRIECDLYYIRNWSFWFDLKILALTIIRGFINKNAY